MLEVEEATIEFQRLGLQARSEGAVTGAPSILCPPVQSGVVAVLGVDVWTSLTVVAFSDRRDSYRHNCASFVSL